MNKATTRQAAGMSASTRGARRQTPLARAGNAGVRHGALVPRGWLRHQRGIMRGVGRLQPHPRRTASVSGK